jgi:hypothetical protein
MSFRRTIPAVLMAAALTVHPALAAADDLPTDSGNAKYPGEQFPGPAAVAAGVLYSF